jgi:hypothetical protein
MGFKALHGIVDCPWIIGEPIEMLKEAAGEGDEHSDRDRFLRLDRLLSHGRCLRGLQRLFRPAGRGHEKNRWVMSSKGGTLQYIRRMHKVLLEFLARNKEPAEIARS